MKELHRALLFLFVLGWAGGPAEAEERVAHIRFPAYGNTLHVNGEAYLIETDEPKNWAQEMELFRASIETGRDDRQAAASLGRSLLSPAEGVLREANLWIVEPPGIAPLSALIAPWSGKRVLLDAAIVYSAGGAPAAREFDGATGALIVAPFHPESDPSEDAPDTLQWELAAAERRVELIPRIDANASGLRPILDERDPYAICWFRGDAEQFLALAEPLREAAPILLWTQPMVRRTQEGQLMRAASYQPAGQALILDLYRRGEAQSAPGFHRLFEALSEGQSAAFALRSAKLWVIKWGSLRDWAGWICVGDGGVTVKLRQPWWFQRWLRREPVSAAWD